MRLCGALLMNSIEMVLEFDAKTEHRTGVYIIQLMNFYKNNKLPKHLNAEKMILNEKSRSCWHFERKKSLKREKTFAECDILFTNNRALRVAWANFASVGWTNCQRKSKTKLTIINRKRSSEKVFYFYSNLFLEDLRDKISIFDMCVAAENYIRIFFLRTGFITIIFFTHPIHFVWVPLLFFAHFTLRASASFTS